MWLAPSVSGDPGEAAARRGEDDIFEEAISVHVYVYACLYLASLFASFWSGNDYVTRVRDTGRSCTKRYNVYIRVS